MQGAVVGAEAAVAQVLAQRGVEEEPLLRHQQHPAAQLVERHLAEVDAAEAHRAHGGSISRVSSLAIVVLPDPVSPTTATLARRDLEGDVVQHVGPPG